MTFFQNNIVFTDFKIYWNKPWFLFLHKLFEVPLCTLSFCNFFIWKAEWQGGREGERESTHEHIHLFDHSPNTYNCWDWPGPKPRARNSIPVFPRFPCAWVIKPWGLLEGRWIRSRGRTWNPVFWCGMWVSQGAI